MTSSQPLRAGASPYSPRPLRLRLPRACVVASSPDYGGTTDDCGGDPNQVAVGNHSDNDGTPSSWLACGAGCAAGGTSLDYSVKSGSPLLHAGSASYLPPVDYAGNPRPCSGQTRPNVGAYERTCS